MSSSQIETEVRMAIQVPCPSCRAVLKAGDHLAGKRLRCPRCGQPVPVPTGVLVAAATSAPAAAPRAPAGEGRVLACPGCSAKFKTRAEWAGKSLKCPRCTGTIQVPPADPGPAEEDWIDITEAYRHPDAPAPVHEARREAGNRSDGWGEEVLEGLDLPDAMREQIRAALTRGERLVWADRPLMNVLLHRAARQRLVGILTLVGITVALPALAWFLFRIGEIGALVAACLVVFLMLVFQVVAVFMIGSPGRTRRGAATRPCYLLTNRRLLLHRGVGRQTAMSRGGTQARVDATIGEGRIDPFTGFELLGLRRDEDRAFPGTGELIFSRDLLDAPTGERLFAVDRLEEVEKRIRSQLIDPVIDRLLRGEASVKEHIGRKKERPAPGESEGEVLPTDDNVRDLAEANLPVEGNVKALRSPLEQAMKEIAKELREQVEVELTDGEKLLWVGKPEGKTQGRGFLESLAGSATRVEPDYTLYAITSRRVLLWDGRSAKAGRFSLSNEQLGPISYYPPQMLDAGLEEDRRLPDGGSIVFRRVKVVITRRDKQGKTETETSIHHFGILRVRHGTAVARLLFSTLIRPCRRS